MELTLLLESGLGLLVLLAILVFMLLLSLKKKKLKKAKKVQVTKSAAKQRTDLAHLKSIIKTRSSSTAELKDSLELIIKHHGTIHKKLGQRAHPDFDTYMDILFTICRHPNTNKDIILKFDRALEKINPEYKPEINEAIAKGLNSRGI